MELLSLSCWWAFVVLGISTSVHGTDTSSLNSLTVCWALPKPTDQTGTKITQMLHAVRRKHRPCVASPAHMHVRTHTHTHTHTLLQVLRKVNAHPEEVGVGATLKCSTLAKARVTLCPPGSDQHTQVMQYYPSLSR